MFFRADKGSKLPIIAKAYFCFSRRALIVQGRWFRLYTCAVCR
jgi:hypothetical protein